MNRLVDYLVANPGVLAAVFGIIGTFSGAGIAFFATWIVARQNRIQQDRQHIRTLAIQLALEEWKQIQNQRLTFAKSNADRTGNYSMTTDVLEQYVLKMMGFADAISTQAGYRKVLESMKARKHE